MALLLCATALAWPQVREGNFSIRFAPDADLQANAEVPFHIHVLDDLRKPLMNAQVTLQIETAQHTQVKIFRAPQIEPGVYLAKPVFPFAGQWIVYVEVHHDGEVSARTIEHSVPETASR